MEGLEARTIVKELQEIITLLKETNELLRLLREDMKTKCRYYFTL